MYSYRVYGLKIDSSVEIAGLHSCTDRTTDPDFHFETGPAPAWTLEGRALPGRTVVRLAQNEDPPDPAFLLTDHGQGRCYHLGYSDGTDFVISGDGLRVWGAVTPPLTDADLATYFLGPVLGFLLRSRRVTALHASAIELGGRAVVFCGDAGFGKSTTAAAMALRGHRVLSEDIVPLEESKTGFVAVPGYPRVCLWPDSVKKLMGAETALPALTPVWEKRYLPLDGVQGHFAAEKLPIGMIYLLSPRSTGPACVEEMSPRKALLDLVQNTYMNWLLEREQRALEFDTLARLVAEVPVRQLTRSTDATKIGELCDLIERDVKEFSASSDARS